MSITINVSQATGGSYTATATNADGVNVAVSSSAADTLSLTVGGGVGPPGAGNVALAAGDGILITSTANVATINCTVEGVPESVLENLSNVFDQNATTGDVLAYNGTAWASSSNYATLTYVDNAVANLVDAAPGALDTLNELAAAIGDDANFSATITTSLAGKAAANHTHSLSSLSDVIGTASANQTILYNGTTWQPGNIPAGTTINGLTGAVNISAGSDVSITTVGQQVFISATGAGSSSSSSLAASPGDGLRLDDFSQLELADDPPRDVSLVGFSEDGLRAVFDRQATGDTDRGSATYEVEFLQVANIPAVVVADQVGDANRTLSVQGLVQAGQRWAELGVSSDNGSSWLTQRLTLDDDSGVWAFREPPPGSLRSGQRLLRVRGADTASNLTTASYSSNFAASYDVAGYHAPAILQSQCSGAGVSVVGVLADEDLSRSELNLSAADVRVGWLPDGGSATYATTSAATGGWLEYWAYTEQRNANSTVFASSLTAAPEGWGTLLARVEGDEGAGDDATVSENFYNFAGNYTLPKATQAESTVFLVATTATATNLPAGVTSGVFAGAIATRRDSPGSMFVVYQPDAAQEFEYSNGNVSQITLDAQVSASSVGSVLLIAEADGMYPLNDGNANWSYTSEPTLSVLVTDASGVPIASQTASPVAGEATELAVSVELAAGSVYSVSLTVSHASGSRALVPQVRLWTDEGGAT